jgi:hypothetical protein
LRFDFASFSSSRWYNRCCRRSQTTG